MKLIMIKDYKNWKANEVIETKDGFGLNFLIKNKYAVAYNDKNVAQYHKNMRKIAKDEAVEIDAAQALKNRIEKISLTYFLKASHDVVHGSVSSKTISKDLQEYKIDLPKFALKHVNIKSFGTKVIEIKLHKKVTANLTIEVKPENE